MGRTESKGSRKIEAFEPLEGGIYALSEDIEMKEKLTTLTRRLEELEMRSQDEMQVLNELPASQPPCFNC